MLSPTQQKSTIRALQASLFKDNQFKYGAPPPGLLRPTSPTQESIAESQFEPEVEAQEPKGLLTYRNVAENSFQVHRRARSASDQDAAPMDLQLRQLQDKLDNNVTPKQRNQTNDPNATDKPLADIPNIEVTIEDKKKKRSKFDTITGYLKKQFIKKKVNRTKYFFCNRIINSENPAETEVLNYILTLIRTFNKLLLELPINIFYIFVNILCFNRHFVIIFFQVLKQLTRLQ